MIRLLLMAFLGGCSFSLQAFEVEIRLFSDRQVERVSIYPDTGNYFLIALSDKGQPLDTVLDIYEDQTARPLRFSRTASAVQVHQGEFSLGSFAGLLLRSRDPRREFRIEAAGAARVYHGDLRLRPQSPGLQVVNIVHLEHYVAGVVESEGGHLNRPEYFKAQAVLARTFALRNLGKHRKEGYNLKDDVTSQVYFSRARHKYAPMIRSAVYATRDTVVVTEKCDPILGVFHANSGGYCTNSEDVWLQPVEYLREGPDSFSVNVGSYQWEKTLPEKDFTSYIAGQLGVENDIFLQKALLNFDHKPRQAYFEYKRKRLKLTKVRNKFGLRSTYFTVTSIERGEVRLSGRGYGHGVGMSQDGAMEMARQGFNYKEIIGYYFSGVELESMAYLVMDN